MFVIFSYGIWLAVLLALAVLAKSECSISSLTRARLFLWGVLLAGAVFVFFRPHENIRSGEDPGVYVNTAARFASEKGVFYQDKLLVQISSGARYYFLFGHRFYGVTKDSCFGFKNIEDCILGPRFSSLYPLLMSVPCMIAGSPVPMLYVAPLFAVLTGLLLVLLSRRLIDHPWVAPLVFFLYSVTPLVVWHGRAARAEVPAGFFIFAGVFFLVKAWQEKGKTAWADVLFGACCITAAPFFHVSSWFVAIPAGVLAVIISLSGRRAFLVYPPVAAAGVAAFIWIAANVTDHYHIMRYVEPVLKYSTIIIVGTVVLYAFIAYLSVFSDRILGVAKKTILSWFRQERCGLILRASLVFVVTGILIWMYIRAQPFDKRNFTGYEYHYAYPTDLRVVREFVSRLVCLLTVLGMGSFLLRPGKGMLERVFVFLCLLPAALLMGNMYDIFMTRYLVPVFLPLMILCLASLITLVPVRRAGDKMVFMCVAGIVCFALMHNRTQLITVTEGRGTVGFAKSFAREIDAGNSILLAEYARTAAPFEHLFGIPLLSLDNETRIDYRQAMEAWERLMIENPGKKAYFLTPFAEPVSSRFLFKKIRSDTVEYNKLPRDRYKLPREKKKASETLTLYSMELSGKNITDLPFVRRFDSSNMGIWNFSKSRVKQWQMPGFELGPEKSVPVKFPAQRIELGSSLLLFFAVPGGGKPLPPKVHLNDEEEPLCSIAWKNLADEWWVQVLECPAEAVADGIKLFSENKMYLTGVQIEGPGGGWTWSAGSSQEPVETFLSSPFNGRWSLSKCGFDAPVPEWEDGCLFVFLDASGQKGSTTTLKLRRGNEVFQSKTVPVDGWKWLAWPLKHLRDKPGFSAFDFTVEPAYDPGLEDYPHDLGVKFGYIVVLDQIHL